MIYLSSEDVEEMKEHSYCGSGRHLSLIIIIYITHNFHEVGVYCGFYDVRECDEDFFDVQDCVGSALCVVCTVYLLLYF